MKKNLLALVLVAIICAVAAQFLRQGGPNKEWTALHHDMVDSLERFWNTRGHQVELLPGDKGVNVRAQVVMPSDTNARQQQWNFPFLRFVAQRHPKIPLGALSIDTPQGPLAPAGSATSEAQSGAVPRPYAGGDAALDTHLELVRRQAQTWLDNTTGSGSALALVDGTARQVAQPGAPGVEAHFIRAREESEGKRAPESDNSTMAPQVLTTEYTTFLVVVLNGSADDPKFRRLPELYQLLQINLERGDSRRMVVLPPQ